MQYITRLPVNLIQIIILVWNLYPGNLNITQFFSGEIYKNIDVKGFTNLVLKLRCIRSAPVKPQPGFQDESFNR